MVWTGGHGFSAAGLTAGFLVATPNPTPGRIRPLGLSHRSDVARDAKHRAGCTAGEAFRAPESALWESKASLGREETNSLINHAFRGVRRVHV